MYITQEYLDILDEDQAFKYENYDNSTNYVYEDNVLYIAIAFIVAIFIMIIMIYGILQSEYSWSVCNDDLTDEINMRAK